MTESSTVSIGLLLEAAQSHQELAEESLKRLQLHAQGLDEVVRDAVRRTVVAELGSLAEHSEHTIHAMQRLQRTAQVRAIWAGTILTAVPALIAALVLWRLLPSPARISSLRGEEQQLRDSIARLSQSGGRIDLRQCGVPSHLCVRVDKHAPSYGERSDYLVVQGY
jgi:hypothetical protein